MSNASFRNAPVAALVYELFYDAFVKIAHDRVFLGALMDEERAPFGIFDHSFMSKWEWSSDILKEVGAIVPYEAHHVKARRDMRPGGRSSTPYHTPIMTLEECLQVDFSAFETFDNYCFAMFTFEQFVDSHEDLKFFSPRFPDAVAAKDDIFEASPSSRFTFNRDRFDEKVMSRWEEMSVREFRAVSTLPRT